MRDAKPRKAKPGATADAPADPSADALRTNPPVVSSVEDLVRILEREPGDGFVLVGEKTLRDGLAALLDRSRRGDDGADPGKSGIAQRDLERLFGDLTPACGTFLEKLLRTPGETVPRQELARAIAGGSGNLVRFGSLRQNASRLRGLLGPAGRCIEAVWGRGYRWNRSKEPPELSRALVRFAGFALLLLLVAAAGVRRLAFRDGEARPAGEPFRALLPAADPGLPGEPSASVGHVRGRSPRKAADGLAETWFESAGPARAGDWLMLRFAEPVEPSAETRTGRRIEILCGRPDAAGAPRVPPCRVECTAGVPGGPADPWLPLGEVDPETGRFSVPLAELPASPATAVRVVVAADSDAPFAVSEAGVRDGSGPDADGAE